MRNFAANENGRSRIAETGADEPEKRERRGIVVSTHNTILSA
jgi:hypothetical protein